MSGGGELAAVFQARRSGGGSVTTNKKMEATVETTTSSMSSGELTAILQVRKKMVNGDVGSSNITTPPRPVPTAVAVAAPLLPSPVAKDTPKFPLPSPKATTTPATTTTFVSASPVRNKTLTATFESRDLEVGIPTPGFLQDMRKNLKKPGEKKVVTSSLSAAKAASTGSSAGARGGAASDGDDTVEKAKQTIAPEQRDKSEGGLTSSAKLSSTTAREQSHQDLMAARRSRMVASRSARSDKSDSSGSGTPASNNKKTSGNTSSINNNNNNYTSRSANTKSDNSIGGGTPTNKNKIKTLLPIKISTPTGTTSSVGGTLTLTPGTPASARREKLRARVRASSSSSSTHHLKTTTPTAQSNLRNGQLDKVQTDLSADEVSSPGKVFISSPTKDEFEMSFFDANHPGPTIPDFDENGNDQRQKLMKQALSMELRTDSVDSMYKDLHTSSTGSTLKTANNSSASRDFRHRASTPKICGSQQSVYNEQKYTMTGGDHNANPANPANHRRESSNGSSDPYNHLQPYAVTRSPSQGSQMSAITTPSCFPQDNAAYPSASGGQHGMNAPVILEAITSFGSTPTSKSSHEEMMHLREQMKEFKQKLAEKDAIISQLMRRISDLEQGHPRTSFGTGNNASAFSSPKANASTKVSNSKGGHTGDSRRKPFNNLASQSVQSIVRSTEMKKFVC